LIILTRLGCGLPIALNPDLIERAESTPDTVVTLVDGHKLVVEEPMEDVVALVRSWRASVAAEALTLARIGGPAGNDAEPGDDDRLHTGDVVDAVTVDTTGHGTIGGRVLRLPVRGV
jgi:flagellar protein FlbD